MSYENIIVKHEPNLATIVINRPQQLNALNSATIKELSEAIKIEEANEEVRVIIITGAGEKAFVAGADIKEFYKFDAAQGRNLSKTGHDILFNLVENLTKPVIAAINGFALGGGLELAMSSHIRVASTNAKLGLPEVSLGVIPGYGGTQRLAQLVGKGKAFEMILTAEMISAEDALRYGLVNHVVEQSELMDKCKSIALKIAKNSPVGIKNAIKSVNAGFYKSGFDVEIDAFGECFDSEDFKEGTTAFLEKRKARFTGK